MTIAANIKETTCPKVDPIHPTHGLKRSSMKINNRLYEPPEMTLEQTFMRLVAMTTPHGYEAFCWPHIPGPYYVDKANNVHVHVDNPDGSPSNTMFSCHCDTADRTPTPVVLRRSRRGRITTDGRSILGADCKIGVALMIKMIFAGIPGWYIFHAGEEVGCIGSRWFSTQYPLYKKRKVNKCIAFDRKGYTSVITHQLSSRTCSDEFAQALADSLNRMPGMKYTLDPTGIFTDSYEYKDDIPECTNLSVGYWGQHSHSETQDIRFADKLLAALLQVDWETLPVKRDPLVEDFDDDGYGYFRNFGLDTKKQKPSLGGAWRKVNGKWVEADDIDLLDDEEWKAAIRSRLEDHDDDDDGPFCQGVPKVKYRCVECRAITYAHLEDTAICRRCGIPMELEEDLQDFQEDQHHALLLEEWARTQEQDGGKAEWLRGRGTASCNTKDTKLCQTKDGPDSNSPLPTQAPGTCSSNPRMTETNSLG